MKQALIIFLLFVPISVFAVTGQDWGTNGSNTSQYTFASIGSIASFVMPSGTNAGIYLAGNGVVGTYGRDPAVIEKRSLTDGSLIWSKSVFPGGICGGAPDGYLSGVSVDNTGIYTMGSTTYCTGRTMKVSKLDSFGNLVWSKSIDNYSFPQTLALTNSKLVLTIPSGNMVSGCSMSKQLWFFDKSTGSNSVVTEGIVDQAGVGVSPDSGNINFYHLYKNNMPACGDYLNDRFSLSKEDASHNILWTTPYPIVDPATSYGAGFGATSPLFNSTILIHRKWGALIPSCVSVFFGGFDCYQQLLDKIDLSTGLLISTITNPFSPWINSQVILNIDDSSMYVMNSTSTGSINTVNFNKVDINLYQNISTTTISSALVPKTNWFGVVSNVPSVSISIGKPINDILYLAGYHYYTGDITFNYLMNLGFINSIIPTSGVSAGGGTVVITGTNFIGTTAVTFGGVPAPSFTVDSATQITAVAPAHSAGVVSLTITNPVDTKTILYTYSLGAPATPTVTTPTVTAITSTGATLGANVTSLGEPATITARGTCWGTTAAPITNCTAEGGLTTGIFTHARTGMTAGTTYYYRGYATNSTGTGYSTPDGTFTTGAAPTVTTPTVTAITAMGATLGANVTSLGTPATITARGTCVRIITSPTWSCLAEGGLTAGVFTQVRTGAAPVGTTYVFYGYAKNSSGTGISSSGAFTTAASAPCTLGGTTVPSGSSLTAFQFSLVPAPATCASVSEIRNCNNGTLSGSYANDICSVVTSCTLPWGGTLASGGSVTAYQVSSSLNCASASESRTCNSGTLSGSFTKQGCAAIKLKYQQF